MDWSWFDSAFKDDVKEQVILARNYIDGGTADSSDIIFWEKSMQRLGKALAEHPNKEKCDVCYQQIALALCEKRDALFSKLDISIDQTGSQLVAALSKDAEGRAVLGAFALLNQGLLHSCAQKIARRDAWFKTRSYDFKDLVQAATYGVITDDNGEEGQRFSSSGILSAAMRYKYEGARFSTYAIDAIEDAMERYIQGHEGKQHIIRWPGDSEEAMAGYTTKIKKELHKDPNPPASPVRRILEKEREEAMEYALTFLTPQEKTILLRRQGGETRQEIGDDLKLSIERIRQVEARAKRKLSKHIPEEWLDLDFVDSATLHQPITKPPGRQR